MKCRICGEEKEESKFYTRGKLKRDDRCSECVAALMRARRERLKALGTCSECGKPREEGYTTCPDCRVKQRAKVTRERTGDPVAYRLKRREAHLRKKRRVFDAYGGCKCACCGETHMEFLSIDHIDGKGAEHRRTGLGPITNGAGLYSWLIKNNFPAGLRVLCMNCNFSIGHSGYCPHGNLKPAVQPAPAPAQGDPCPATT